MQGLEGMNARCKRKGEKGVWAQAQWVLLLEGCSRVLQHDTRPCSMGLQALQRENEWLCRALGERSSCSEGNGAEGYAELLPAGTELVGIGCYSGPAGCCNPICACCALRPSQQRSLSHQEI